ncbi:ABC transporter permease subunit [Paenibacillus chondroitinus]|uniref:ABC transporter permease subunit n=2 Tax=Paenibacillus TaxID=44249 RepID=A0ABU6DK71_9BACL|nr:MULTISPECIES: ABC transporter permease subunit [Paenibacillus]MCY9660692.1 ABC transporter permease subunit [Paenibacillus anseongense]MEB4798128.1 ABC transporter permease subunit [Paenibacillus chondroitinus]
MQDSIVVTPRVETVSITKSEFRRKLKSYRVLYFMLLPGLLYFLVFHYIPIYGVVLAFKNFKIMQGIMASPWVGFDHFEKVFADPNFYRVLNNTLIISLYKIVFAFPIPIIFALLLSEITRERFKKLVQTISYLPHFMSWVILAGIFISIFSLNGPMNAIVKLFGGDPVLFMADDRYFRSILVLTDIYQGFGWGSIVYFAAIAGIDPQLQEAAIMDGANRFKRIIYITLPMLLPVISIMLILRMAHVLDAGFDQIFNMYNPKVYGVSDILDTFVYRKGLLETNYSYATAVGLFKSVVALVLIVLVNKAVHMMGGKDHTLW